MIEFLRKLSPLLILFVISCNTSSLSKKNTVDLSEIGSSIEINQDPYDHNKNQISVLLFDYKGKQIGNDKIKILVNKQELDLDIKEELYYTKKIRYKGGNIPVTDSFDFEIKLPDGSIFPLSYTKAIQTIQKDNILFKEEIPLDLETKITWKEMKEFNNLIIWKSYNLNNTNSTKGGRYDKSTLHLKIKENGSHIVPVSYYKDSISTINYLSIEFQSIKSGLIHPDLIPNSNLKLISTVKRNIKYIK
ncbi:hypothetical protein [Aquimarina sp. 2201CG5-10]|uniref:hypothetical protein n=1 Tax=Aquimarina callyspongiae TaxID=3098150 RepID=UPI002AB5B804|nr:hypothetical protein [Aquimarina sp. 2201CG5-10]MDY8135375.1 hypothetical protein [Aquimarina sp. 2201CG5-10]